jgi:hypothetical protein
MRAAILAFAAALILRPCGFGWPFLLAGAIAVKARIAASVLWISFCSVSRCDFSSETMPARFVMPEFYGERQAGVKGGASGLPRLRARPYSFASFRILLPTTKAAALQSSHVTKYPCVIWPCHISGPSDDVTMPCAPFGWESPCVELIFSTRVPVRNAAEDCSTRECIAGVIKSPQGVHLGCVGGCASRHFSSEPWSLELPSLLGRRNRQRHLISSGVSNQSERAI